jgi:hypothetical protein
MPLFSEARGSGGVQGYPDTTVAGAGVDVVLAGQCGLHLARRDGGVPERDDVPACRTVPGRPVGRPSQRRGLLAGSAASARA